MRENRQSRLSGPRKYGPDGMTNLSTEPQNNRSIKVRVPAFLQPDATVFCYANDPQMPELQTQV